MDTEREIAPMKRAIDAFDVDTSIMSIEEVVEKIANEFHSRINK
jgi:cytidylate kinase